MVAPPLRGGGGMGREGVESWRRVVGGGEGKGSNMNINENGIDGRVCKVMCMTVTMPIATGLS